MTITDDKTCFALPNETTLDTESWARFAVHSRDSAVKNDAPAFATIKPALPEKSYFHADNKYKMVARALAAEKGSLLDIGARNQILKKHLPADTKIEYHSADASEGCEFQLDLEKPLQFTDGQFDHVVSLDVLEHVENAQAAFAELVRITNKKLIIALPNMATLRRRILFLTRGDLGTDKYDLYPFHQGDRHRWLTLYHQIMYFYGCMAAKHNLKWEIAAHELEHYPIGSHLGYALNRFALPARHLFIDRVTAVFSKRSEAAESLITHQKD